MGYMCLWRSYQRRSTTFVRMGSSLKPSSSESGIEGGAGGARIWEAVLRALSVWVDSTGPESFGLSIPSGEGSRLVGVAGVGSAE